MLLVSLQFYPRSRWYFGTAPAVNWVYKTKKMEITGLRIEVGIHRAILTVILPRIRWLGRSQPQSRPPSGGRG